MLWTIRLVVCFVAVNSCSKLCDATRLEEFLQEKQAYLQEFDLLFDTLYFNTTSHNRLASTNTNAQRQVHRSQPLPSPDWSTHSISFDDVTEEEAEEESDDYLDASQGTLFEEENYRPRKEAGGRDVRVEDDVEENSSQEENVFSGDSGLFLTEKPGDDDEGYEDLGSGDSRKETTTIRRTTSILQETSTSVPVEPNDAFNAECKDHLRTEIRSCIEFSWNVRTMLHETENFVPQSGYYNVSSSYYFYQLFRTCASTISSPPSCLEVIADRHVMDVVHNIATRTVIAFASRNKGGSDVPTDIGQSYLDCFHTHLQFVQSCLGARLTNGQLETLVRIVVVRAKDGSVQECRDLNEVQQCVTGSMTKCEDSISVGLVKEMFEAAKKVMTCSAKSTESVNEAVKTSSGTLVMLVLSILSLGLHKQIHN